MFGQCGYFNGYAAERIEHGINRYCGETKRLYGLIDRRLGEQEYLAGENYSLADMATFPWMIDKQQKFHGIDVSEFTNVQRWLAAINSRPGAQRGMQVMAEDLKIGNPTEEARKAFFHRD
jgi:GST-like protein